MDGERFYIRESDGYATADRGAHAKPVTEILIPDRAYCHRVVWSRRHGYRSREHALPRTRSIARSLCFVWNAEDSRG